MSGGAKTGSYEGMGQSETHHQDEGVNIYDTLGKQTGGGRFQTQHQDEGANTHKSIGHNIGGVRRDVRRNKVAKNYGKDELAYPPAMMGAGRRQTHQDKMNERLGEEVSELHEHLHEARGAGTTGAGTTGAGTTGAGRKPNARAAIVRKVMAEHGMKMIEASKYVKAHGLYQK
jgi:hypothetical protein